MFGLSESESSPARGLHDNDSADSLQYCLTRAAHYGAQPRQCNRLRNFVHPA